ncbi:MAG: FCD domain-containing protein [Kiritimatiellales bacterium]
MKNRLFDIAQQLDRLAAEHDQKTSPEFARLHHEFHLTLAECTGSRLLLQMLQRIINPSLMMLNAVRSWIVPSEVHQNHTGLIQVIAAGNTEEAIAAIQAHIQIGLESELAVL